MNLNITFINYENSKDKDKDKFFLNKNKICDIIKFINRIADIDIINYTRKLKSSSFKINFNNISKIN